MASALGPETKIVLQTTLGNLLILDDATAGVTLETTLGHSIMLNAEGITLRTSTGNMLAISDAGSGLPPGAAQLATPARRVANGFFGATLFVSTTPVSSAALLCTCAGTCAGTLAAATVSVGLASTRCCGSEMHAGADPGARERPAGRRMLMGFKPAASPTSASVT